jgi:hypothetical protein
VELVVVDYRNSFVSRGQACQQSRQSRCVRFSGLKQISGILSSKPEKVISGSKSKRRCVHSGLEINLCQMYGTTFLVLLISFLLQTIQVSIFGSTVPRIICIQNHRIDVGATDICIVLS